MKRIFVLLVLLATFTSAQTDSTDILIFVNLQSDTLQSGRWRPGMGVVIRESTNKWAAKEKSLSDSLFVIIRCGIQKARIDSFLAKHPDSTSGLKTKYQLSRAALRFIKNNRDQNNIVRLTPAQLRNAFKRTNRLRHFGETQRMGIIPDRLYIKWRNIFTVATEIVVNIDTDGGAGADYSSLAAAIAGESAIRSDLVARNEVLKLMCISSAGSPDTTPVSTSGFVTDFARKIDVVADNSYKLLVNLPGGAAIYVGCDIVLRGVKIEFTGSSNYLWGVLCYTAATGKTCTIINCQIKNFSTGWSSCVRVETPGGVTCHVVNTIMSGGQSANFGAASVQSGSLYIYNSIAFNSVRGFSRNGGSIFVKNSIAQNCADGFNGTFAAGSDYNISDLAGDAPGANSLNSTSVNFADASAGDFRLLAGSPGIDQGTPDTTGLGLPMTDIAGNARISNDRIDIGAFEYQVSAPAENSDKKNRYNGFGRGFRGGWKK